MFLCSWGFFTIPQWVIKYQEESLFWKVLIPCPRVVFGVGSGENNMPRTVDTIHKEGKREK